jgi:hypothetical protein
VSFRRCGATEASTNSSQRINQHYRKSKLPTNTYGKEKLKQLINQAAAIRVPGSGALHVEDGLKLAAETVT